MTDSDAGVFQDYFSGRATEYSAHRPTYPAALSEYLADLTPRSALAWDCGCGSGQLAVSLASRFDRVVATDASREQLSNARRRPRVHYRAELAESSSLPPASTDLATAAQAAHWFDLEGYYREVRRVCRPGSVVALITYGTMSMDGSVDRILHRFTSNVLRPHWPSGRRHVEERYRSLPFPFEGIDAPQFTIYERRTLPSVLEYVGTWSAVRRRIQAEGGDPIGNLRDHLSDAWGPPERRRSVRWPLTLRVGYV